MYIYIHVPFCNNICSYCDFAKVYYNKEMVNKYLVALKKEIIDRYNNEEVKTIYIGGGTPTSLDYKELSELLEITNLFNKKNLVEFSIESNIEIDIDKINLLKEYNVNRISLGVQSFDSNILSILNRTHNKEDVINTINLLKNNGFNNINIDLIYGVNEDINVIKSDIDTFLSLNINHISYYSLILEENTMLYNDKFNVIDEDIEFNMFKYIDNVLCSNNYNHYEVSNYCKDNYECIHNLNYWNNGDYYGFGLGAVSYINNYRITNTRNMSKYINNDYIKDNIYEDIDTKMYTDIMLGFRLFKGIDIKEFKKRYNRNIDDVFNIENYLDNKILLLNNNYLRINKKYIYLMNEILINIMK